MRDPADTARLLIVIRHPHGDVLVTLGAWMEHGPGQRPGLTPRTVYNPQTGTALPLNVIPLRYGNTLLSRVLIALKIVPSPWKRTYR
jgi:hypothetical protein